MDNSSKKILLHGPLKENFLRILHNKKNDLSYQGLPEDPAELYKELSTTHKKTLNKLAKDKVFNKNDLKILLPTNTNNKTDSNQFDVTLITVLIINCTTLQPPKNGWNQKSPPKNDPSVAANVLLGRNWRNYLNHTDAYSIDQAIFDVKWDEGVDIVQGLGGDVSEMATLKTTSLDPKQELITFSLLEFSQIEVDKLRRRVCVLETTTNTVDSQTQQTAAEVQQIDGKVQKIDDEVQQIQQRLDRQIDNIASDKEAIHNKIDDQTQQIDGKVQQIDGKVRQIDGEVKGLKKKIADHNLMSNQLKEISIEMEKLRNRNQKNFIPSNRIGNKPI